MKVPRILISTSAAAVLLTLGVIGCEQRTDTGDQPRGRMDETVAPPFGTEEEAVDTDELEEEEGVGRFERSIPEEAEPETGAAAPGVQGQEPPPFLQEEPQNEDEGLQDTGQGTQL